MGNRANIASIAIGLGIELVMAILPIPPELRILGLLVGLCAIAWGVKELFGYRFRSPFYRFHTQALEVVNDSNQTRTPIEFYENRSQLNAQRGQGDNCIKAELAQISRMWVAWPGGSTARFNVGLPEFTKIERMILRHPKVIGLLGKYAQIAGSVKAGGTELRSLQSHIESMTKFVQQHNIEVKWLDKPFTSFVVGDPNDPDITRQWIRVEVFFPYDTGDNWPSFVVIPTEQPNLFAFLMRVYDDMWGKAQIPNLT